MTERRKHIKPWTEAQIAQVRAWVEVGTTNAAMAQRMGLKIHTFSRAAYRHGIQLAAIQKAKRDAGAAVLRQYYETETPREELLKLYSDARGRQMTMDAMFQHSFMLDLKRDKNFVSRMASLKAKASSVRKAFLVLREKMQQERRDLAPALQAAYNAGASVITVTRDLGISKSRQELMRAEGLVTKPPRIRVKSPPKPRPPRIRPKKERKPKPQPAPKMARPKAPRLPVEKPRPSYWYAPEPKPVVKHSLTTEPPPPLPEPAENGKIYACFRAIRGWAEQRGFEYDGTNMHRLNMIRAAANMPLLVQEG